MKHSTRDGQRCRINEPDSKQIDYFLSSSCSQSAIYKYFTWQKVKYVWSGIATDEYLEPLPMYHFERQNGLIANDDDLRQSDHRFFKHQIIGIAPTLSFFKSCSGLTSKEAQFYKNMVGVNKMDLPLTPLLVVFLREILTPFYLFQAFSVAVWISDEYVVYAYIIIILAGLSAIWQIVSIRLGEVALRKTMHKTSFVQVVRTDSNLGSSMIDPSELVPGDVIIIPKDGCILQCDAALMNGTCLTDEAMLTGESVPVLKFGIPPVKGNDSELLQIRKHERNILFCGTKVLQANCPQATSTFDNQVYAVVIRTGFMTAKGELTRLILYPKPFDFQFAADAAKFVCVMSAMAAIGVIYSIIIRIIRGEE